MLFLSFVRDVVHLLMGTHVRAGTQHSTGAAGSARALEGELANEDLMCERLIFLILGSRMASGGACKPLGERRAERARALCRPCLNQAAYGGGASGGPAKGPTTVLRLSLIPARI